MEAGIMPDQILPSDIDETPKKKEKFVDLVKRLAMEKCHKVASNTENGIIIAADTIVVCKGRLLEKAVSDSNVKSYLQLSSGSRNHCITSVYIIKKEHNIITKHRTRTVKSIIKFKPLSEKEIDYYVASGDGIGKAGGIGIIGASMFIKWIRGSVTGIIGLPICETKNLLESLGYEFKGKGKD
jgi:septum formation protein